MIKNLIIVILIGLLLFIGSYKRAAKIKNIMSKKACHLVCKVK